MIIFNEKLIPAFALISPLRYEDIGSIGARARYKKQTRRFCIGLSFK